MRDDQAVLIESYQDILSQLEDAQENEFIILLDDIVDKINSLQANQTITTELSATEEFNFGETEFEILETAFANDKITTDALKKCRQLTSGNFTGSINELLTIIQNALTQIETEQEENNVKISSLDSQISSINSEIIDLSFQKNKYKKGTTADIELEEAIETKKQERDKLTTQKSDLESKAKDLQDVHDTIEHLISILGSENNKIEVTISSKFADILIALGQTTPDIDTANQLADEIYVALSESTENSTNNNHSEMLKDFIHLRQSLQNMGALMEIRKYCRDSSANNILSNTEYLVSSYPSAEEKELWQKTWNDTYIELKNNYNKLSASSHDIAQANLAKISYMQRYLLTNLNGIERSLYYLSSEHSLLAKLSLFLALFLDIIPIIFRSIKKSSTAVPTVNSTNCVSVNTTDMQSTLQPYVP